MKKLFLFLSFSIITMPIISMEDDHFQTKNKSEEKPQMVRYLTGEIPSLQSLCIKSLSQTVSEDPELFSNPESYSYISPNDEKKLIEQIAGKKEIYKKIPLFTMTEQLIDLNDSVKSISFSPDGKLLVVTLSDAKVHIYKINNDKTLTFFATLTDHTKSVKFAAFNPSGTLLITLSNDTTACLYKINDDNTPPTLITTLNFDNIIDFAIFSPDETLLALIGPSTIHFYIIDTDSDSNTENTLKIIKKISLPNNIFIEAAAFHPDNSLLMTLEESFRTSLYKITQDQITNEQPKEKNAISIQELTYDTSNKKTNTIFSPDGTLLAVIHDAKKISIYKINPDNSITLIMESTNMFPSSCVFSKDNQLLSTHRIYGPNSIYKINPDYTLTLIAQLDITAAYPIIATFNHNDQLFAIKELNNKVCIFENNIDKLEISLPQILAILTLFKNPEEVDFFETLLIEEFCEKNGYDFKKMLGNKQFDTFNQIKESYDPSEPYNLLKSKALEKNKNHMITRLLSLKLRETKSTRGQTKSPNDDSSSLD